ncbi:MAG: sulfotransferase domain-containing protein [Verrucomicrobiota bacterium]|nr:sulfotransferase domain-containing protein [Verrucomicrobiota bacterium]
MSDAQIRPNLFIVGASKCGTTAWVEYLCGHPDVLFSNPKEPHFFTTDSPRHRRVADMKAYLRLFESAQSKKIIGDGSASYLYSTEAAANIRSFNPAAKIIIFLREQEAYLPSWHNELCKNGAENVEDFETAWRMSGRRDGSNTTDRCSDLRFLDYKSCGRFSEQVERFFANFPREQIRVFHFRDWTPNPRSTYLEILSFLGLQDDSRVEFRPVNQGKRLRSKWLARLLSRPPRIATVIARSFKAVTGVSVWVLAGKLAQINLRKGYVSPVSDALKEEIRLHYKTDNARMEAKLRRPTYA